MFIAAFTGMESTSDQTRKCNAPCRAVLIFADSLATDLARRGWSRRFAALLQSPRFDPKSINADVHLFTSGRARFNPESIHQQRGKSFGERLSNAVKDLATRGYDQIVIVGRDCPELSSRDIRSAFDALSESRAVLGPDHRGGCYLIGIHTSDRSLLDGITWQRNTDFEEIRARAGVTQTACLEVKLDLDSMRDVHALASRSAMWRAFVESLITRPQIPPTRAPVLRLHHQRLRWQLPPPEFAPSPLAA